MIFFDDSSAAALVSAAVFFSVVFSSACSSAAATARSSVLFPRFLLLFCCCTVWPYHRRFSDSHKRLPVLSLVPFSVPETVSFCTALFPFLPLALALSGTASENTSEPARTAPTLHACFFFIVFLLCSLWSIPKKSVFLCHNFALQHEDKKESRARLKSP